MKNDLNRLIGLRIRTQRLKMGFTQEELAALCECDRTYVGMVERAEKNISVLALSKFAAALQTTMSELLINL